MAAPFTPNEAQVVAIAVKDESAGRAGGVKMEDVPEAPISEIPARRRVRIILRVNGRSPAPILPPKRRVNVILRVNKRSPVLAPVPKKRIRIILRVNGRYPQPAPPKKPLRLVLRINDSKLQKPSRYNLRSRRGIVGSP